MSYSMDDLRLNPRHGLPTRPVLSYRSPTRRGGGRGKHSKASLNQENPWPQFRAPTRLAEKFQQRPLANWSCQHNLPSRELFPLEGGSKHVHVLDCPVLPQPLLPTATPAWTGYTYDLGIMPFLLPHLHSLRPRGQVSSSPGCNDPETVGASPSTPLTPVARRRLAVERMKKAASDAAVRKMNLHGGFGWGLASESNQPANFASSSYSLPSSHLDAASAPFLADLNKGSSTPADNGSTTPCDSSFASEEGFDSDPIIFADVDIDFDGGSTTPCDTSYDKDPCDSILFDDLDGGSTTPLWETSFSIDQPDIHVGSTTPCDTSLAMEPSRPSALDGVDHEGSTTPCESDASFDQSSGSIVFIHAQGHSTSPCESDSDCDLSFTSDSEDQCVEVQPNHSSQSNHPTPPRNYQFHRVRFVVHVTPAHQRSAASSATSTPSIRSAQTPPRSILRPPRSPLSRSPRFFFN